MMRRRIVHVLLSLLLLVSQQMAFAHAMSHLSGTLGGKPGRAHPAAAVSQPDSDKDLSSAVAQDRSCSQCLVFAQMATAIGSTPRQFAPPGLRDERIIALATTEAAPRTVCAFHSRAPPSSV
jgi:hypothetical protein